MRKKILSINLWFEKYGNKTRGQLKAFRDLGYETHVATIISKENKLILNIIEIDSTSEKIIHTYDSTSYRTIFRYLFDFCLENNYSLIYIRRLMSKLLYAAPFFKKISKVIPIVYEIPTYPLDTGNGFLYRIRDKIEMTVYKMYNSHINLTLANVISDINLPDNWQIFHNAIDMSEYNEPSPLDLDNLIKFIIVANISEYHHYERMLKAMKNYKGEYCVHLTVISPDSKAYNALKSMASDLNIQDKITFLPSKTTDEICNLSKDCHIGVGQLSTSEKGSNLVNTLKSKDYCAMGIPFFSTCYDTSFEKNFPYIYITESMDDEIDLNIIIEWYLKIHADADYRKKMYLYAKNNLQYDVFVKQIIESLKL